MTNAELIRCLRSLGACDEALEWIKQTHGEPKDLWTTCQRGDWMIWLLVAVDYDKWTMRHLACDFAEDVLPIYERAHPDDSRPRDAIAMARRYADGEATKAERHASWDAAWTAAKTANSVTATAAAYAAAWTASGAAAWGASNAATEAASSNEARTATMSRQADIIRTRVSWTNVEQAIKYIAYKKE